MAKAIRSNRTITRPTSRGGETLSEREAWSRGITPANTGRAEAPHGGATRKAAPKRATGTTAKRGTIRAERRKKALGPTGRARARVDAIPHGKHGTKATPEHRPEVGITGVPKKKKPVRGSPMAKRRIENRHHLH